MQCFQLPNSTSRYLDRCNTELFSKKCNTEKGLPLIAWDKVCMPKSRGGLGLQKTEVVNKAFQCKLALKILTNAPSIWVQSIRAKYLHTTNLFCCKQKNTDLPVWKSLLKCRGLLQKGILWKIGRGDEISFWFNNWVESRNLVEILGVAEDSVTHPEAKVYEFIQQNSEWDILKLRQFINNHPVVQKI